MQQLHFNYANMERPRPLRDVRYKRTPDIQGMHCYFLGFRINKECGYQYHDAMILADDFDAFLEGVVEEFNDILDRQIASSSHDIALVFVRSLMMRNSEKNNAFGYHYVWPEIQEILSKRDDEQYTVFGLMDEDIWMLPVTTSDALAALRLARWKAATQLMKNFIPLEICQAHPVKAEFDARFEKAALQVKLLIETQPGDHAYRQ
jgi:hypothetical protein